MAKSQNKNPQTEDTQEGSAQTGAAQTPQDGETGGASSMPPQAGGDNRGDEDKKPQMENGRQSGPALEDLAVLAARHRVASWQQAALLRLMGWADGKMVSDADYQAALRKLQGRRMGGGRLA